MLASARLAWKRWSGRIPWSLGSNSGGLAFLDQICMQGLQETRLRGLDEEVAALELPYRKFFRCLLAPAIQMLALDVRVGRPP